MIFRRNISQLPSNRSNIDIANNFIRYGSHRGTYSDGPVPKYGYENNNSGIYFIVVILCLCDGVTKRSKNPVVSVTVVAHGG